MSTGRAGDPPELDPKGLRRQVDITMSREDLENTFSRVIAKATRRGALAGALAAILVGALMGFYVTGRVTHTVRHDVGHAAIINCDRASTAAGVLRQFLTTDAAFNAKLGKLDLQSARIDRDLSRQVATLGSALPTRIAGDYQAQSRVFQQLAVDRAAVADLWAGKPKHGRRAGSLARNVLAVIQAHCDQILTP